MLECGVESAVEQKRLICRIVASVTSYKLRDGLQTNRTSEEKKRTRRVLDVMTEPTLADIQTSSSASVSELWMLQGVSWRGRVLLTR